MKVCMECGWTEEDGKEEPRMLGLALIPGRHVVCICIDTSMPLWSSSWLLHLHCSPLVYTCCTHRILSVAAFQFHFDCRLLSQETLEDYKLHVLVCPIVSKHKHWRHDVCITNCVYTDIYIHETHFSSGVLVLSSCHTDLWNDNSLTAETEFAVA